MMFYCWDKDPAERPSFTQLVKDLEALLTKETNYIDLNQFPDHAYYNEVRLAKKRHIFFCNSVTSTIFLLPLPLFLF
jgi:hypothetical protein